MNHDLDGDNVRGNEGQAIVGLTTPDREDSGLAALEGLSLEELAAIAARLIGESRQLQAEAFGLARRSTCSSRGPQFGTHHALAR